MEGKPLECHEQWSFDEGSGVMRFVGLQCLSEDIHRAKVCNVFIAMRVRMQTPPLAETHAQRHAPTRARKQRE